MQAKTTAAPAKGAERAGRVAGKRNGRAGLRAYAAGRSGMELVQVAILVAIAVDLGLIFKTKITVFVNSVFGKLLSAGF